MKKSLDKAVIKVNFDLPVLRDSAARIAAARKNAGRPHKDRRCTAGEIAADQANFESRKNRADDGGPLAKSKFPNSRDSLSLVRAQRQLALSNPFYSKILALSTPAAFYSCAQTGLIAFNSSAYYVWLARQS